MAPGKMTALAGGARCLRDRHRLILDRALHTAEDGARERQYWCSDKSCGRYGVVVASRPV